MVDTPRSESRCHTIASTRKGGSKAKKKKKRSPPLPLPFFFRIVSSSSPLLERPPRTNMTDFCDLPPPDPCTFMRFYTSSTSSPRAYYPTGKFPMARFPRVMRFFIYSRPQPAPFYALPYRFSCTSSFSTPGINRFLERKARSVSLLAVIEWTLGRGDF